MGKISKFMTVGWDSPPSIPKVSRKGSREWGDISHLVRQQSNIKEEEIFGKKRDIEGIILGDNPVGHCFILTDLVP